MSKKDNININSGGGPVFTGKVDNRKGKITGRSDNYSMGLTADNGSQLFVDLFTTIDKQNKLSKADKTDIKEDIQEIRKEFEKGKEFNESFVLRRLRNIGRMAPDILEVTLATIVNPILGYGVVAKKIAEKAKQGFSQE